MTKWKESLNTDAKSTAGVTLLMFKQHISKKIKIVAKLELWTKNVRCYLIEIQKTKVVLKIINKYILSKIVWQ